MKPELARTYKFHENSGFVVSALVVGSGEQDNSRNQFPIPNV